VLFVKIFAVLPRQCQFTLLYWDFICVLANEYVQAMVLYDQKHKFGSFCHENAKNPFLKLVIELFDQFN